MRGGKPPSSSSYRGASPLPAAADPPRCVDVAPQDACGGARATQGQPRDGDLALAKTPAAAAAALRKASPHPGRQHEYGTHTHPSQEKTKRECGGRSSEMHVPKSCKTSQNSFRGDRRGVATCRPFTSFGDKVPQAGAHAPASETREGDPGRNVTQLSGRARAEGTARGSATQGTSNGIDACVCFLCLLRPPQPPPISRGCARVLQEAQSHHGAAGARCALFFAAAGSSCLARRPLPVLSPARPRPPQHWACAPFSVPPYLFDRHTDTHTNVHKRVPTRCCRLVSSFVNHRQQ